MRAIVLAAVLMVNSLGPSLLAQEAGRRVSGPQVGDKISPFTARGVLDDDAGKEFDLVTAAQGRPLVLCFVHEVARPSVGLARLVLNYAASRKADGLDAGLILLTSDVAATQEWVQRVSHVLPRGVPILISPDGAEGPAAYGLNRQVQVTVIVAKENKVTTSFASVQPTVEVDAPKIAQAIVDVLGGGAAPSLEELQRLSGSAPR